MRILISLTYYRPHVSGLTIYVERLARQLVERGHQVTVLTSRHDPSLPSTETMDAVRIVRAPVVGRIGKGPVMPTFGVLAARLLREHDIASLHLPQAESPLVAVPAKAKRKPVVLTYHCDLQLPEGPLNRMIDFGVDQANRVTGRLANAIVAYTEDYARYSSFLRSFSSKIEVIGPPVVMPSPTAAEVRAFRERHQIETGPVLGYASRFATEKGIEFGIEAALELSRRYPDLRVLFAGPWRDVIGENAYRARLESEITKLGDRWTFLGALDNAALPAFYGALDVLLMTSVNSTESFGLVQVESMLCGTPVVATDLPGVRQPVLATGMGEIVEVADSRSLADGIEKVLSNRQAYVRSRDEILSRYDIAVTTNAYERLFERLVGTRQ